MPRQGACGVHIIVINGMGQYIRSAVVDEDCRHTDLQFSDMIRCERRIPYEQGIHLLSKYSPNQARLTVRIVLKCGHKHTVLELMSHTLDSAQDFTVERISNTVDDDPQHMRTVGFQTACETAGHVVEFVRELLDPRDGCRRDRRMVI